FCNNVINPYQTLIEHWNGSQWSIVPSQNVGPTENYLLGVTAISANDLWAVGYYYDGTAWHELAEHWNGTAWSIAVTPNVSPYSTNFAGVAAVSASNVWAVGAYI